ncbi:glycosyltransferase involved in cell wall biosynthesis [Flavobacterium cutihirudinis]|uniref:Glycosyltransferase involved in cell wall biosynthesis n=1 Tax=Flavobacterium cutihirudinis TaxID=1265740 RepID=A0A3D9FK90_9FLAO|nr:glycosyltransferase [Flavobacterium cutihirudinis]RED19599.1 glycosyltransferase involved in cell wall biosynthesis [Flavobacterium cutihirudinis]
MKILLVITDYGSFNNFLAELAVNLSHENQVHVICSESNIINIVDKFDYAKYNLTFHKIDIPRSTSIIKLIKSASKINQMIKSIKPNLVYAHFTTGIFPTVFFKKNDIVYWGAFHGLGMNASSGVRKIMFSIVELFCFWRLDKIFTINNKDFSLVKSIFKQKATKYTSCGVGCDIDKFDSSKFRELEKKVVKEELKIDDRFVITYTGRFVEFKGFDLVYKSFMKLTNEFPNKYILLLIGGKDPIHITGLTEQEELNLSENENIVQVGYTSQVEKYLAISDVFLFPSKKEGLPVCIVEALAMGLPVITLDERGNSDVVKNDFNGYLVKSMSKSEDIVKIVERIKYLSQNSDVSKLFSENSLKNRSLYSRDFFISEQIKLFNDFKSNE